MRASLGSAWTRSRAAWCLRLGAAIVVGTGLLVTVDARVERYAWYPWNTNNNLVDDNGNLTSLGAVVAAAPATR